MLRLITVGLAYALVFTVSLSTPSHAQSDAPLRVGIVGLVHGHVHGFLEHYRHSPEIEIVGVSEPDHQLLSAAGTKYGFDQAMLFTDLEEMIAKAHPQAVLVYTSTFDHRRVVEISARHGVHVVMEKPLATTYDDALAIERAAHAAKIHVLVNYDLSTHISIFNIRAIGSSIRFRGISGIFNVSCSWYYLIAPDSY